MRAMRAAPIPGKKHLKQKKHARVNLSEEEKIQIRELSLTMGCNDIARKLKRSSSSVRDVIDPGHKDTLNSVRNKKRNPDHSIFDWNDYNKRRII